MGRAADGSWDPMAPAPRDPLALTPREHAALLLAPKKRGSGTQVTVRAYPVAASLGQADHMYEQYDDGREEFIYRGGPKWGRLHAEVTPARQSKDDDRGVRVVDRAYLPGVTARQAAGSAQQDAARVNAAGRVYGVLQSNSNTLVADHTERQFGRRVGDDRTWGSKLPSEYPKPAPIPGVYPATLPIW